MTLGVSLSPRDSSRVPELQSVVKVFQEVIAEGPRGAQLQDAIIESVLSNLFVFHAMVSTPNIFRAIRMALAF